MTRPTIMDKERLAAFADGELSPEDAAAVVMHLADHPADQAFVDDLMAANLALARAFAAPAAEAVPERFRDLILPEETVATGAPAPRDNVVAFAPKSRRGLGMGLGAAGLALAASLAMVAFLPASQGGLGVGPVAPGSALAAALDGRPSGSTLDLGADGQLTVLATLPAAEGHCREFELIREDRAEIRLGLACGGPEGWTLDVLLAETVQAAQPAGTGDQGYVAAAGADAALIEPWLDRRGAGLALTPQEEQSLIARGWQP